MGDVRYCNTIAAHNVIEKHVGAINQHKSSYRNYEKETLLEIEEVAKQLQDKKTQTAYPKEEDEVEEKKSGGNSSTSLCVFCSGHIPQ